MMTIDSIKEALVNILKRILEDDEIEISNYDEKLSHLGLDSLSFISFIVEIEEEFNIELPNELLSLYDLENINKIAVIVNERLSSFVDINES